MDFYRANLEKYQPTPVFDVLSLLLFPLVHQSFEDQKLRPLAPFLQTTDSLEIEKRVQLFDGQI